MRRSRVLLVGLLASAVGVVVSAQALADTAPLTATVAAGALTEATVAAPSLSVTLNGTDQTGSYTLPITVLDARGAGSGWNLTITSTQFTTGGGSPNTLSTSASTITAVSSTCAAGVSCTNPTNSVSYPLALPAGSTAPTGSASG